MMTLEQAIDLYLTEPSQRTGELRTDLIEAGKRARWWMTTGKEATAVILNALHDETRFGMSVRDIASATGIPTTTVQARLNFARKEGPSA